VNNDAPRAIAGAIREDDYPVIRPASYGLGAGTRGYLLYWEHNGGYPTGFQMIDSWTVYKTVAEAEAAAQMKRPGVICQLRTED
jgi:hypothetical protein